MVPEFLGDNTPGVSRVLEGEYRPFVFPVWLTTHRELNTARRVRLVFDLLAQELLGFSAPR